MRKKLKFKKLKKSVSAGVFGENDRRKKMRILEKLIRGAKFLNGEKIRRDWISRARKLNLKEIEKLSGAILRENFRFKKGERNLNFRSKLEINFRPNLEKIDFANFSAEDFENENPDGNLISALFFAVGQIFLDRGPRDFQKTKFKLLQIPAAFFDDGNFDENLEKFFREFFAKVFAEKSTREKWQFFVEKIAQSFLLFCEIFAEIENCENDFPAAEIPQNKIAAEISEIFASEGNSVSLTPEISRGLNPKF